MLAALPEGFGTSLVERFTKGLHQIMGGLGRCFRQKNLGDLQEACRNRELHQCQQKQTESMRAYIGMFTKLLNAVEDISVDRAIDAFSDGIRRGSYIEELGRKKPKTITKLM
jgi:hypothetical protein